MSKKLNYYINFKEKTTGKLSRGLLIQAKCERSALFTLGNTYNLDNWEVNKIVEIPDKVYNRLVRLNNLRIKREHDEWVNNGGYKRMQEKLAFLTALSASIDGPYGKNGL